MNSKIKGMIVGVVVLVCLGITLAVLTLTGKPDTSDSSSDGADTSGIKDELTQEEETIALTELDKNSISKLTFTNPPFLLYLKLLSIMFTKACFNLFLSPFI